MSRTKRSAGSNSPVKKYVSFAGGKGKVKFFDKEDKRSDDKGKVFLESLDIIVLDIKSSIQGFYEAQSASISSNLIDPYDIKKVPLAVKTKINGKYDVFSEGLYGDIKDEVFKIGGKFTTSIFALADVGDGEGLQIIRLDLNGSGLTPWIKFKNDLEDEGDIYDLKITVGKGQLCSRKGGKTVPVSDKEYKDLMKKLKEDPMADRPVLFYEPSIKSVKISKEEGEEAIKADEELQEYLTSSSDSKDDSDSSEDETLEPLQEDLGEEEESDLPF